MKLLPNEEKIMNFRDDFVTLTDLRINHTGVKWGKSYTIDIFLEDISSVEKKYKSYPLLLLLSGISIIYAIVAQNSYTIGILFALGFILIWLLTRTFILQVSSDGGAAITLQVHKLGNESIEKLMDEIFLAKHKRINHLYGKHPSEASLG